MHCKDSSPRARYGLYVPVELIRLANNNQIGNVRSTITRPLNHNLFMKRLREVYRISKAVLMSKHLYMSSYALDDKKARYKYASCKVKVFRHQVKLGLLTIEEMEEKRKVVFSLCADGMNDIEDWTSKHSRLLSR